MTGENTKYVVHKVKKNTYKKTKKGLKHLSFKTLVILIMSKSNGFSVIDQHVDIKSQVIQKSIKM